MDTKKILILAGGGLAFLLLVLVILFFAFLRGSGPVTLTYWGLWEPEAVYQTVIADYKRTHPNVTIKYVKQSPLNYRDRLTTALAANDSPDIARIHNTWLPMLKNGLATIPTEIYSTTAFKNTFYPVATELYPYAIPLEIDGLALYVNDDIFRAGGVEVPTIWDGDNGFLAVARKLTVKDTNGRIKTAGAAMGTASNVDHWQDIVGLMMVQTGVDLAQNTNSQAAVDALDYYMAFAREGMWNETLDNSTLAFANGQVAMYFGPSWRYFDIKQINPNLNFHITPVPQLAGSETVNYASYWAEAVSKKSRNQKAAFEFMKFLSSKEQLAKLYEAQTNIRGLGEPYSRVDMASLLATDPYVGPFILAAPSAKSWYLASFTGDGETGINSRIGVYFSDAINSLLRGGDTKTALDTVQKGVSQVLSQYGTK